MPRLLVLVLSPMLKILVQMQCTLVLLRGLLVPIPHGSNTEAFGSVLRLLTLMPRLFVLVMKLLVLMLKGLILTLKIMVLMLKLLDLKKGAFGSIGSNAATFGDQPAKYACLT